MCIRDRLKTPECSRLVKDMVVNFRSSKVETLPVQAARSIIVHLGEAFTTVWNTCMNKTSQCDSWRDWTRKLFNQSVGYTNIYGNWETPKPEMITYDYAKVAALKAIDCLLYTSPSPRDGLLSRMPSSA
eukprot:TRINITY_DN9386_c0_g1_i7.p1 TRINITY_DN9386_c0_g1~~TRINITY_DN9386_c0_g1_i7.p1  ORF type:complete len:129 (-),score=30.18 TRINITY_DN9386_c0_g1_i7:19-405(-)